MKWGGAPARTRLALVLGFIVTVTWVSLTRPLSPLYHYLHSKSVILREAHARNHYRLNEARDYFRNLQHFKGKPSNNDLQHLNNGTNFASESVKFVIVVITTERVALERGEAEGDSGYLLQTAAKMHAEIHRVGPMNGSFLFVCNVDTNPEKHGDAVFLRDYIPFVELHGSSSYSLNLEPPKRKLPYPQLYHNTAVDKERWDYIFCLHSALALTPRSEYVMVLQDDVIPLPDMSIVLEDVLERIRFPEKSKKAELRASVLSLPVPILSLPVPEKRTHFTASTEIEPECVRSFAFLKLYLPEKWRGFYLLDPLRMIDLASFAVLGAAVFLVLLRISFPNPKSFRSSWLKLLEGLVFSTTLCLLVGRANLNELRRASKHFYRLQPAPGCCTPAMLYPADVLPVLMTWLAESPAAMPVDMRIDGIAGSLGLPGLCVEPVLFRHIGMSSTLGHSSERPEEFLLV